MAVIELVINPVAGKGRALRIGEEAAALLKAAASTLQST